MASLASFVSRMPKHADNIDLPSGAGVKPMPLIYVQEEASLSLIAAAQEHRVYSQGRSCRFCQSSLPNTYFMGLSVQHCS